jgi:lipopolysaccharide export system protein LptC
MAQYVQDPNTGRLIPATEQVRSGAGVAPSPLDRWQQRDRPRVEATVGYSRFVRIMKVMLPLVAFSLVVLVVLYSASGREGGKVAITATNIDAVDKDRQLVNPKLTGTDGRGQPFTVTAKGATQAPGKTRKMVFDNVVADVTMQDKSWVQVDAKVGLLDGEAKTLDLTESINIFSDKGYECHTTTARYDFGLGLLKGENPISCQGPLGLINAKKFEGLREPGIMRFTGGVSTTYFPTPREGTARDAATTNPEGIAEALPDEGADGTTAPAPTPGGATMKPIPNPASPAAPTPKPKATP